MFATPHPEHAKGACPTACPHTSSLLMMRARSAFCMGGLGSVKPDFCWLGSSKVPAAAAADQPLRFAYTALYPCISLQPGIEVQQPNGQAALGAGWQTLYTWPWQGGHNSATQPTSVLIQCGAGIKHAKHRGAPKISSSRSNAPWVQMMKRPRWPPGASCNRQQNVSASTITLVHTPSPF